MIAAGVLESAVDMYAACIDDGTQVPFECKQLLQVLSSQMDPSELFQRDFLALWDNCNTDELVRNAVNGVELLDLVDAIDSHPNEWKCCEYSPIGGDKIVFRKYYELKREDDDEFPQLDFVRKSLGYEFTPGSWYYHGTQLHFAFSYLRGIALHENRPNQDFNIEPAFYLHADYSDARRWAECATLRLGQVNAAVVAYFIPDNVLATLLPNLDLDKKDEPFWCRLISCSRRGDSKSRYQLLSDDLQWIRGSMCANPTDVEEGKLPVKRNATQLALGLASAACVVSKLPACL